MRTAVQQRPGMRQTAVERSVPAPTGGWDTESPLAKMPTKNAIILDNWVPLASEIVLRKGFVQQVTGTPAPVEAMIAWRGDPSGDRLFACSGADIYDVTTQGALGSAVYSASASAASARWKSTNFANDAGAFALAVNGESLPIRYNGTSFSVTAITGVSGALTLNPRDLNDVMAHKRRLHLIEKGTLRVWFLGVNAIAGPAGLLDMGGIFNKGGRLVAQGTWTLDGGQGSDDLAVYITNEGQVAIWQGTDPADSNNWALIGVYDLGRPIGERCLIKWGADLAVITEDGIVPLSQALDKDRAQDNLVAITKKVATAFSRAATSYGSMYGWSGLLYAGAGSLAIINVPTAELSTAVQYVQAITSGGWCRFTGLNAICWEVANGGLYFGGADGVYLADTGSSDNGETIVADVKPAFSNFGYAGSKEFTMVRPLLKAPSIIQPALEVLTDYRESVPTATPTVIAPGDVEVGDADEIRYDWTSAGGFGTVGTPRMRVAIIGSGNADTISIDGTDLLLTETAGDFIITRPELPFEVPVSLIGFDLMFIPGGPL